MVLPSPPHRRSIIPPCGRSGRPYYKKYAAACQAVCAASPGPAGFARRPDPAYAALPGRGPLFHLVPLLLFLCAGGAKQNHRRRISPSSVAGTDPHSSQEKRPAQSPRPHRSAALQARRPCNAWNRAATRRSGRAGPRQSAPGRQSPPGRAKNICYSSSSFISMNFFASSITLASRFEGSVSYRVNA